MISPSILAESIASCSPASDPLVSMMMSRSRGASSGDAKGTPRRSQTSALAPSTSTTVTSMPGMPAASARDGASDHPRADDGHPVADEGRGIPEDVDRGLDGARQHGSARGNRRRHDGHGRGGHHERRLVREQREHRRALELGITRLDHADVEVAVLDRSGEVPGLEGRTHAVALALGHLPSVDQGFGAAADARVERPHEDFAGRGRSQILGPEPARAGILHPE